MSFLLHCLLAATVVTAGGRAYTMGHADGKDTVFRFDAATGKILWSVNVQKEIGCRVPDWGFTGAPLVLDGRLILNVGEAGVALDKTTGKILWKSADKDAGYSTPLPVELGGRTQGHDLTAAGGQRLDGEGEELELLLLADGGDDIVFIHQDGRVVAVRNRLEGHDALPPHHIEREIPGRRE